MPDRILTGQRMVALFAAGWLLFDDPLLGLFNRARMVFGIPLLYAYLFAAWALFICVLACIVEWRTRRQDHPPSD